MQGGDWSSLFNEQELKEIEDAQRLMNSKNQVGSFGATYIGDARYDEAEALLTRVNSKKRNKLEATARGYATFFVDSYIDELEIADVDADLKSAVTRFGSFIGNAIIDDAAKISGDSLELFEKNIASLEVDINKTLEDFYKLKDIKLSDTGLLI